MPNEKYEPTNAQMLAALVIGRADMAESMATVQRSHRFPLHAFAQIENMARLGKMPVSAVINLLIESGLDSVKKELPEDVVLQIRTMSQEQANRPTKSTIWKVDRKKPAPNPKYKSAK